TCTFTVNATRAGKDEAVLLKAGRISATVSLKDGRVSFFDAAGKPILQQDAESMKPVTVGGKPFFAIKQGFNHGTRDAYYGLGQHQNS
ncbi:hypothetical protein ABTN92_20065, partial [Acinetobacter baumannii]